MDDDYDKVLLLLDKHHVVLDHDDAAVAVEWLADNGHGHRIRQRDRDFIKYGPNAGAMTL